MSPRTQSQSLRRRSSRTVPATITAIALLALAVVVIWGSVAYLTQGSWPAFASNGSDAIEPTTWSHPSVSVASGIAAILGLLLLIIAILPGKQTALEIIGSRGGVKNTSETVISPRGLARLTSSHVDQTDGVDSSSVTVTAKRVTVDAKTSLHQAKGLSKDLEESITEKFDSIGLSPIPKVTVRVHTNN